MITFLTLDSYFQAREKQSFVLTSISLSFSTTNFITFRPIILNITQTLFFWMQFCTAAFIDQKALEFVIWIPSIIHDYTLTK